MAWARKKSAIESRATTLLPREVAATHAGLAEGRAMKTKTNLKAGVITRPGGM